MPHLSKEFKQAIQEIPEKELQELILKAASKNLEILHSRSNHLDYIYNMPKSI